MMDTTHVYAKPTAFANRNCPYALVGGIVFGSVYDAETYCAEHGLDPDAAILTDDPDVLCECKRIAVTTLPALRNLKAHCSKEWENIRSDLRRIAAARDEAEKTRMIGWEVHNEWVREACGRHTGYLECMDAIADTIATLERVLYMK